MVQKPRTPIQAVDASASAGEEAAEPPGQADPPAQPHGLPPTDVG